tara:strand:- start:590 stop:829 length:240 start_codon:yes stop_codon:yes gene_type:complete
VWNRYGGKRGGAGGAGGESFELGDKAGAEEEGEEALRVAEWIAWRKERGARNNLQRKKSSQRCVNRRSGGRATPRSDGA